MRRQKTIQRFLWQLRRQRYMEENEEIQGAVRSGMIYALRWVLGADFNHAGAEMTQDELKAENAAFKLEQSCTIHLCVPPGVVISTYKDGVWTVHVPEEPATEQTNRIVESFNFRPAPPQA